MYNKLGKDEIIVSISLFIFVLVYRILEDYQVNMISSDLALLVLMLCTAYLCFYNLDMIISVGYRVRSQRGVQFRIWASGILKEYMRIVVVAYNDELHFYEACGFEKGNNTSPMFITSLWT